MPEWGDGSAVAAAAASSSTIHRFHSWGSATSDVAVVALIRFCLLSATDRCISASASRSSCHIFSMVDACSDRGLLISFNNNKVCLSFKSQYRLSSPSSCTVALPAPERRFQRGRTGILFSTFALETAARRPRNRPANCNIQRAAATRGLKCKLCARAAPPKTRH